MGQLRPGHFLSTCIAQTVADMIIYNRSAEVRRSRFASANRQTETLKLRLKLPYAQEGQLRALQELVKSVLEPPASATNSSSNGNSAAATGSLDSTGSMEESSPSGGPSEGPRASPVPVAAATGASARSSSPFGAVLKSLAKSRAVSASRSHFVHKITHPVVPGSVEVVISKFTDAGLELLVKAKLRLEPGDSMVQALLLDLSRKVRELGAMMINL